MTGEHGMLAETLLQVETKLEPKTLSYGWTAFDWSRLEKLRRLFVAIVVFG
jgi:hypothetical protein